MTAARPRFSPSSVAANPVAPNSAAPDSLVSSSVVSRADAGVVGRRPGVWTWAGTRGKLGVWWRVGLYLTVLACGWSTGGRGLAAVQDPLLEREQAATAGDAAEGTPDQVRFFESKIRPVLVTNCYSCHSQQSGRSEGGLDVDTAAALRVGGDSGPAIEPADYTAGWLWKAINYDGLEMPPQHPLPAHVIEDFRVWLEAGAPDPRVTKVERGPYQVTPEAIEEGRQFWSLQKLPRSSDEVLQRTLQLHAPKLQAAHPIDRFVELARHQQKVPTPPAADSYTLFRRLCLDLLGLPPTAEQVDWFQQLWRDDPDTAVTKAVTLMLDSPKFGERWGRHWLDIVRYAESTGREVNMPYPQAWRYRDYVIDSFNNDKPYDRFLKEQLAGDLLPVRNQAHKQEQLIATGFLALGPKTLNERSQRQFEADVIDEQIDVATRSILGISVACARCHDHKFEAITQQDYYALAGIFSNATTHFGGVTSQRNRQASKLIELPRADQQPVLPALTTAQVTALQESLAELNAELRDLRRTNLQNSRPNRNRNPRNEADNATNDNQAAQEQQRRQQLLLRLTTQIGSLQGLIDCYHPDGTPRSLAMGVQAKSRVGNLRLLERGEVTQPGEMVPRGFVQLLEKNPPRIRRDSSGRLELANWIANRQNPLTARVMANRVWLHLIGEGIVRTPEDFGVTGSRPTHPELLDYLALRLIENKWSIKALIREITTSQVYQMGWQVDAVAREQDPDNHYLWRSHPQRLAAETMRDSLLWVGGTLDVERPQGSLVAQAGPFEIGRGQPLAQLMQMSALRNAAERMDEGGRMESMSETPLAERRANANPRRQRDLAGSNRVAINEATVNRAVTYRSVYLPIVRDLLPRSLELFDAAEPSMVIGVREQSNTAPQALYLMNNEWVQQQAGHLAQQTLNQTLSPSQAIEYVFKSTYSRPPSAVESAQGLAYLENVTHQFVAAAQERKPQENTERQRRQRRDGLARRRPRLEPGDNSQTQDLVDSSVGSAWAADTSDWSAAPQEIQRQALTVFCHAILATAEFRYRN